MPTTALAPGGLISAVGHRAPVGVVSCITSYNFPMVNMAGKIGPALAMGNTVVVKPAPQDPLAVIRMVELFNEAGFPPGVVNVVGGTGIRRLGGDRQPPPHVDMISFTGSTGVGRRIGEVAGGDMKRLLLELGGKGACIVFDDADLKAAIGGISSVWGFHSGQICTAPTRVIAQRSRARPPGGRAAAGRRAPQGRRPAGEGHRRRSGDHRGAPRAGRGLHLRRPGRGRRGRRGWRASRRRWTPGFYVEPTLLVGCDNTT